MHGSRKLCYRDDLFAMLTAINYIISAFCFYAIAAGSKDIIASRVRFSLGAC